MATIAVVCTMILFLPACAPYTSRPAAREGVFDASAEDFSLRRALSLRGEWRFAPNEFPPSVPGGEYIPVPGSWHREPDSGMASPYGIGTYGLTLVTPTTGPALGLLLPDQAVAYRCYINGEVVAANGSPAGSYADTLVTRDSVVIPLQADQAVHEIVIHVANHHYDVGGLINPVIIGDLRVVTVLRDGALFFTGLLSGALLLIAFYYLLLYVHVGWDRTALLFALFCLAMFARVVTVGHLPERFFGGQWAFEVSLRIEYLSYYGALPLYLALLGSLFRLPRGREVWRLVAAIAAVAAIAVVLLPIPLFIRYTLLPMQILTIAMGVYLLAGLIGSARRKEEGAVSILVGFGLFFLVVVNDILHASLIIHTAHLSPAGLLVFVMAHFAVLTRRHAGAEDRTRELAATLVVERDSLDERVRGRTAELELANEKLRRQEEARLEFVATISHELRTPLTLILTPTELVLRGKRGGTIPADGAILNSIRRNARRIETLIENLVDYSRFELGRVEPRVKPVAIGRVITELSEEFEAVAHEKGLRLSCAGGLPEETWIAADPRLVELAFFNLVSNALKFTPAGGSVDIRLGPGEEDGSVAVEVSDTGIGIEESVLPHIFDKFYRGCVEVDGSRPGSGIGLALTREIVELHGGTLQVASRPGAGSRFTMTFPLLNGASSFGRAAVDEECGVREGSGAEDEDRGEFGEEARGEARAEARSSSTAGTTPNDTAPADSSFPGDATVLVVEDNAELLAFIAGELADTCRVLRARDGVEGLALIRGAVRPDLVIADIMMPRMDGPELFTTVRSDGNYPDLPFLFLTARTDPTLEHRLRDDGAVDYIRKPFDMEQLHLKVRNLVALRAGVRARTEKEITQRLTEFIAQQPGLSGTSGRVDEDDRSAGTDAGPVGTDAGPVGAEVGSVGAEVVPAGTRAGSDTPVGKSGNPVLPVPAEKLPFSLSERERQICAYLARGMTDKEIGGALGIAGRTVSNTLVRLYRKCGVANRTELTALIGR